jgi:hypothetical protein
MAAGAEEHILSGMFLRYYVELPMPFDRAEPALIAFPGSGLGAWIEESGDQVDRLLAEVGFTVAERRIEHRVTIAFRDPRRLGSRTLVPMTWEATGPDGVVPTLEGDLEVATLGPNRTQLSISAMYTPPMGAFGRALDRALLHRVAEATVKDFLDRVAAAMSDSDAGVPANGSRKESTHERT